MRSVARVVGFAASTAVGVAEGNPLRPQMEWISTRVDGRGIVDQHKPRTTARKTFRKIKNNMHKILSPVSGDKSVHKVALPLQFLEFLSSNTSLPKR